MQTFIIPAIWILITFYLIIRLDFFNLSPVKPVWKYTSFFYKLVLGFANYYIWLNVIGHGDSLRYYHDSLIVYNSLFENPIHFFELLTRSSLQNIPEHLVPYQKELYIEWHVNEYNMVRLLAILNVFTFGNIWANIVILSFVGISVSTALFKFFARQIASDNKKTYLLFALIFFLPSLIFWTGGILKEAPVFMLMGIIIIQLFKIEWNTQNNKTPLQPLLNLLVCLVVLFFIRDYLALLIGANLVLFLWIRAFIQKNNPAKYFFLCSATIGVLFFLIPIIFPQWNYFQYAKQEQLYFLSGAPDPDYHFQTIGNSGLEVVQQIPYALNNVFCRPNILHSQGVFRLYQSIELPLMWLLVFWLLLKSFRRKQQFSLTAALVIIVCFELLFIYGLLVTDADTLSRYRSIPLFFILLLTWFHQPKMPKLSA